MLTPQRKEDLRHAAMEFLYGRALLAFAPAPVARFCFRRGLVDFDPSEEDTREALEFLRGLGYVEAIPDPLGGRLCYRVTSAGQLARERGEA